MMYALLPPYLLRDPDPLVDRLQTSDNDTTWLPPNSPSFFPALTWLDYNVMEEDNLKDYDDDR